eukprot:11975684-Alexandrium_andersonii.AAC.1
MSLALGRAVSLALAACLSLEYGASFGLAAAMAAAWPVVMPGALGGRRTASLLRCSRAFRFLSAPAAPGEAAGEGC